MEFTEELRAAIKEELPQIMTLYRSVVGLEGCTWDAFYPNEDTLLEDFEAKQLYVLRNSKQLLGVGSIVAQNELDDLDCWQVQNNAKELARIVIAPAFQGKGYGKLLVQKLCERLKCNNYDTVHILVAEKNHPAQRMYQQIGFQNKGSCHRYDIDFFAYEKTL